MTKKGKRAALVQRTEQVADLQMENEQLKARLAEYEKAEKVPPHSLEVFRAFMDSSTDAFTLYDSHLTLIDLNEMALRYLGPGARREDVVGKNIADFITDRKHLDPLARLLETGGSISAEDTIAIPTAGEFTVLTRAFKVGDGIVIVTTDITDRKRMENQLRESEHRYRLLADNASDVIWVADMDLSVTYVSPSAARMLGCGMEELMTPAVKDVLLPKSVRLQIKAFREQMDMARERLNRTQHELTLETQLDLRDGLSIWVEDRIDFIRDDAGRPTAVMGIMRDITDRRAAEEELRVSEERNRLLIENANEAITVVQDGILKFVNPKFCAQTGYAETELISKAFIELVCPDDRQMLSDYYVKRQKGEEVPHIYQFRFIDKRGSTRWAEINAVLFHWEGKLATLGLISDISDRKEAEEALRENEERFRQITENMLGAVSLADAKGIIQYASPSHQRIVGYRPEELLGRSVFDFVCPEDIDSVMASLEGIMEKREATYRYRFRHADGHYVWGEASAKLLLDDAGNASRFIIASRDITDRKAAEEALKDSEAKYRRLFESTQTAMEVISLDTGLVALANEATARMFGFASAADLIGVDSMQYLRPEDVGWVSSGMAKAADQEWQEIAELQVRTKDGRWLWVSGMTIVTEYQGRPALLASLLDITRRKQAEETLRESEEKYRLLTERTNDVVFTANLNLKNTYVSPSVERILGFTPEEFSRRDLAQQITPESLPRAQGALLEQLTLEQDPKADPVRSVRLELEYYRKDGSTIWMEDQVSGIRDANGMLVGLHGVARDITERTKAQQALKESEERYRLLAENAADIIWVTDANLKITYASPSSASALGYGLEEIYARSIDQLITPKSLALVSDVLKADLADEERRPGSMGRRTVELEVVRKDGSKLWLEAIVDAVRDPEGRFAGFQGACRDITERRKAREALSDSEERYRLLAENASDVIWTTDADLNITYMTPSATRLLRCSKEEAATLTMQDMLTPESLDLGMKAYMEQLALEGTDGISLQREWSMDLQMRRRDGSTVWVEERVNFMRGGDGRMTGLMGITRDISDRKRAEEALRDNEERFRQITENMLDAVSVVDGNGIMLYASPSHRRILGYRPEDLLGKSVFDFVCPEDVDSVMASLAGIMEKQEARYQFRFRHADGHYVWGEASAKLLLDDAGDASRFVIASRDISDRKAAEEALRNSEAKYKALFDHTLLGMEVIDGQTGKTVLANRSLARMFGFESPADMIGINPLDYVLPEDLEWVTGQIAQLMADPAWNKQTLIRSKTRDGRIIWLTGMTTPFEYEGKPGMLISLIDSTLAKEAEQKLKESEEKNRAIIDNAAEAIVVLQDGMVKFINPKGVELMGRYGEEFTPKPFLEFIHPDDRQMMMENHLKRLAGEEVPNNYTFRMLDKEGNTKWMQINAVRLDWEGKPAVLSLLNDITDQVRTHERLKESEERYRLLAENATDVIWATDLDLTITYVSPAVTSLLGYTVEEAMTGVFLNRLLTPDSMAAMMKQHKTDMAGEEGRPGSWKELTVEIEVVAKDGTKFWLEAAINGVRDGEGELTGFQGACRDVTERRRAEQALMERLKELQCIAGIARLAEKPDMPVEEFVRESVSLLPPAWQHPDVCGARIRLDSKEYATADFRETEWCQSAAIRVDEKQFGLITVCYLKEMPAADEGPFLKEERALVDTVADFMGHVIQHRQMEGSLREAKEYAENIIKTANVLVVMLDVDGNVTELNEAGEKITGYGKGEVLGKNWFKLIAPRERYPRVWEEFTRLQSQGSIVETFENPILTRSGEERFISWKNSPLVLKGRTVGALSFGMDITDRKRAEEDLQKARDELEMRVEQRTAELKKANALLTQEIRQRKVAQDRLEESESRYRGLVESANSIILELDTKGKVAFFNRFAQDFFGFSESEILGRHMVGTIAPPVDFEGKDRKTLTKDLVTHPEDYAAIENDCLLKNGDRVWISWTNKGLYDAKGRLRNVLCVGMDRTEQRRVADLLAQQMREKAAGDERQRLARDLHDAVTQTLFSASLIAEVLPRLWKKDRAEGERRLEELRRLTRGALAEMRMLLLELRPAALAEVGLADLLRQLVEAASIQAKLQVAFVSGGTCTAPPDVQVALYRVAQEALNNVVKHSGAAEAEVKLSSRKGSVDLRITDDGSGFDLREVSPKSLGLRIMQERAESIGATLKIDGRVGHGTKVRVQWSDAERKEA